MTPEALFKTGLTQALKFAGVEIVYTSKDLSADPATVTGDLTRLGPDDEGYSNRVGTRYAVDILAADLVGPNSGTAITPQKRDKLTAAGKNLKVVEKGLTWGAYRLVCEEDGRPVPI